MTFTLVGKLSRLACGFHSAGEEVNYEHESHNTRTNALRNITTWEFCSAFRTWDLILLPIPNTVAFDGKPVQGLCSSTHTFTHMSILDGQMPEKEVEKDCQTLKQYLT
jgi:hypothetical protein